MQKYAPNRMESNVESIKMPKHIQNAMPNGNMSRFSILNFNLIYPNL